MSDPERVVPFRKLMGPPELKYALSDACKAANGDSPLGPHIGVLERILMVNSQSPGMLDALPLELSINRSKTLIAVLTQAKTANPEAVRMVIQQAGAAMQKDRLIRGVAESESLDFIEAVSEIIRTVSNVKPSYPRY